ncbi:MAG: hypothetical protein KDC66_19890, partial [Phaeodactylibacter sp.]|nr:hypothetical protein [Phaeodactylibacter sp.]
MSNPNNILPVDWDFIVDTIREEKCILLLGPEIFNVPDEPFLEKRLVEYLHYPDNPDIQNYYPGDNLFLFNSRAGKTKAYYKIKGFYDQLAAQKNELLEKLADIPFSFIINATPDKALSHIFES